MASRWRDEGGYRELLRVAFPLIISTSFWSMQHFLDRMFLTWYSTDALAAVMPAGMVNFTIVSLFMGTAHYAGTFVAQYYGAGRYERVGPAIWQGVYIACIGWVVTVCASFLGGPIFSLAGHAPQIREYEITYFRILCLGAGPALAGSALSGFFSGRGKTWPVMWVNLVATGSNVVLNYVLVLGKWGFPRMGVKGAAIATVIAGCTSVTIYMILLSRKSFNDRYHTLRGWRFDRALFGRLVRFGLPNGVQFSLDIAGMTMFILLVGRLGRTAQAATVLAFSINGLAFMPMIGLGIAISVIVGQHMGKNRPDTAEHTAYSGFHLAAIYMGIVVAAFVLIPGVFIAPFSRNADPATFAAVHHMAVVLLRFVALYTFFDAMNIVFASAIKGAGDTRYVMLMIMVMSATALVAPTAVAVLWLGAGVYTTWIIATVYISLLGMAFFLRFRTGKWKSMRVIEQVQPALPPAIPEAPSTELAEP